MIAEPRAEALTARKTWTYDEVRAIDDDVRRELHDGEIYEMPSPTYNHRRIITRLTGSLNAWAQQEHGGEATASPIDLYISETTYYIPDLVFYSGEQMKIIEAEENLKNLHLAPYLVAEVLSPSTARFDRALKMKAYAQFSIAHYWILDPLAQTLEAFELSENRYALAGAIGAGENYAPAAFLGLSITADALFPAAPPI